MRLATIRRLFTAENADGALLTFLPDVRWACGFTGSNGLLLVLPDAAHFVSDGRYASQARAEVEGATVHTPGYDLYGFVAEQAWIPDGARLVVQADHVTLDAKRTLNERFPAVGLVAKSGFLQEAVAVKTEAEVAKIEAAQRVTEAVFEEIVGMLRPGVTERAIAAEIVYGHLRRGAERMAFEPIVGSGPNGALPHARASERVIQSGDLVVLDMGGVLDGYASDMTRTVAVGEPGEAARHAYAAVLAAQRAAIRAARAGMRTDELDGVARRVIADAGLGDAFAHGLGHGIGLQTHEWPRVSYNRQDVLPEGAAVTIEPGVYLEGRFGVRIEDIVVLGADGCRNLTRTPKELLIV